MIKDLATYIGKDAVAMLDAEPFKNWVVEKSVEGDLPEDDLLEPIMQYVFPKNGLELRCHQDGRIRVVFIHSGEYGGFDEKMLDLPFSSTRQQVLSLFGTPLESGSKLHDPILGEYGAWDKFAGDGYMIHFQYYPDADKIKLITLT